MARGQNFKVGLFVIVATVIMAVAVGVIAGIRLREPVDSYTVRFDESVSGLDPGAAVKFRGVKVGNVQRLLIPADDIATVEASITVRTGTPVKTDTKAKLSSVGITGLKFVDLVEGSPDAGPLPGGSRIASQVSLMESLSGRAVTAAEKADVLLDNLLLLTSQEQYRDEAAALYERLMVGLVHFDELMVSLTSATTEMDTLLGRANVLLAKNEGKIDRALTQLEGALTGMNAMLATANESDLVGNLNATMEQTRVVASDLRGIIGGSRRDITETLSNLRETSANLNDFSRTVRDRPSLLIRSSSPEPRRLPDSD